MSGHARVAAGAVALALASGCGGGSPAERCAALVGLGRGEARVASAETVAAGERGPAHCRVRGAIESEINFEPLLPEEWNGRFVMGGGGGFVVEEGAAPERRVAAELGEDGETVMTRPLCPYPGVAVYSGEWSTDEESSFSCEPPPPA